MQLRRTDVLVAVADVAHGSPARGEEVMAALSAQGRVPSDRLLARLLDLEAGGMVRVERDCGMRFSLTPAGERAIGRLGGGEVIEASLSMVDLVGFVAFTVQHGDVRAHQASQQLVSLAAEALSEVGGRVVKASGDGFFAMAGRETDLLPAVRSVASQLRQPDGRPWRVRASLHAGTPIEHQGDLFGADINLLARLCDAAAPGEVVETVSASDPNGEDLRVRGLAEPVRVRRTVLP